MINKIPDFILPEDCCVVPLEKFPRGCFDDCPYFM